MTHAKKICALPFGSRTSWITFIEKKHTVVLEKLSFYFSVKLKTDWKTGIESGLHFLTSPINDRYFILTQGNEAEKYDLNKLSKDFREVQFFGYYASVGYSEWRKYINGQMIRALKFDSDEIIINVGEPTDAELNLTERHSKRLEIINKGNPCWDNIHNSERFTILQGEGVFKVAEAWSINPQKMSEYEVEDFGYILEL